MTDYEKIKKLESDMLAGDAADEALPIMKRVFREVRESVYQQMEGHEPDLIEIRAKLIVMRELEQKLTAYINSGQMAAKELSKIVSS